MLRGGTRLCCWPSWRTAVWNTGLKPTHSRPSRARSRQVATHLFRVGRRRWQACSDSPNTWSALINSAHRASAVLPSTTLTVAVVSGGIPRRADGQPLQDGTQRCRAKVLQLVRRDGGQIVQRVIALKNDCGYLSSATCTNNIRDVLIFCARAVGAGTGMVVFSSATATTKEWLLFWGACGIRETTFPMFCKRKIGRACTNATLARILSP